LLAEQHHNRAAENRTIAETAVHHQRQFSGRQLVRRAAPQWCYGKQNNIIAGTAAQHQRHDSSVEDNLFAEQHNNGTAEREQHYSRTAVQHHRQVSKRLLVRGAAPQQCSNKSIAVKQYPKKTVHTGQDIMEKSQCGSNYL
jgi:hypothetical protein